MTLYEFDCFEFDTQTQFLTKAGQRIELSPKATELLLVFLRAAGRVLSNEELMKCVWRDTSVVEGNVHFQIATLRKALGTRPDGGTYVENLARRGFRFTAAVVERRAADEANSGAVAVTQSEPETVQTLTHELHGRNSRMGTFRRWRVAIGSGLILLTAATLFSLLPGKRLRITSYKFLTQDFLLKGTRESLYTDGNRVYFGETFTTGRGLADVPVSGGPVGPVPLSKGFLSILDLDPRTLNALAVPLGTDSASQNQLWVISVLGGVLRRVGSVEAQDARWSPAWDRIAITLDNAVYVARADGSDLRKLVQIPGHARLPRWSPDGKNICFTVAIDSSESLWEVAADGSRAHQLLTGWNNPPHECCGVWTRDGNFLVFEAIRDGYTNLWYVPETRDLLHLNRVPEPLTSGREYSSAEISLDGKQIFALGRENRGELERYDLERHDFSRFLEGISATWVSFSQSAKSVVYIRYPDLTIWRSKVDGSETEQLTFPPFEADGLSWSQDEKWLAMRGRRNPWTKWNIYVMPLDGGEPKRLIPDDKEQGIPTWSPDASRIAYGDVPMDHGHATGSEAIHVLDLRTLTVETWPGSQGFWSARWSPDGRFLSGLAIESNRLMVYDFGTKRWQPTEAVSVNNPTWSRDSKYVYYDTEGHTRSLCRVRVADGHVEKLATLDQYPVLAWWWSGVSPDNSPILLRNLGSEQIYALTLEAR